MGRRLMASLGLVMEVQSEHDHGAPRR
jgi:hypothetical protein